ncbi:hypothetical protein N7516_005537 [Penicillium verrucosum]|uniref:uncharacterized protein n=1 Tax=Penicillium verrucosum TaxID=60171 RepID=UPI00254575C4|nr:uncharacterized protein N7516_005537 [Penicillium verrucosum]KAJ5945369.1 hypothetical protein N7516_005537 [Penicillium verrucosum]
MGLAIKDTGAGQRNTSQQRDYTDEDDIQASHLFPYMNGQDTMDAISGKTRPEEPFSPRNGLLICRKLERYFDAGKFVIVPDIPNVQENAWVSTIKGWLSREPREYRVRLIDPDWEVKDQRISRWGELTYGQLENRKLRFRFRFRPAARYLYFHYCVQMLPLVEEMGHEYSFVLDGAAGSRSDDNNLLLGLLSRNDKAQEDLKLLRGGPFWNWKTLSSQILFVCCCALILSIIIFPSSVFSHTSSTPSKLPSENFQSTSDLSKLIFDNRNK